jgi:hypothetical protein
VKHAADHTRKSVVQTPDVFVGDLAITNGNANNEKQHSKDLGESEDQNMNLLPPADLFPKVELSYSKK